MSTLRFPQSREEAHAFDQKDPIGHLKDAFALPEGVTYMVGHSLGPATKASLEKLATASQSEWADGLVGSWNTADWINLPQTTAAKLSPLLGVDSDEAIICDSVSLNIFKLASALLSTGHYGSRLCVEQDEFPTDQYIVAGLAELRGVEFIHAEPGNATATLKEGGILVKSLVDFRTGAIADVEGLEQIARTSGAAIIWDLSHATGLLNLKLHDWHVRFAVGCTYKYLNGGPGAPGFLYVRRDLQSQLTTPLAGWLGHARPFAFENTYEPGEGLNRFVSGTPAILSMASLNAALDLFEDVNMADIQAKANALGDMCLWKFDQLGMKSISPPIGTLRGGHVSVQHSEGYAMSRALADCGHKTDFRTPDTIRLGLSPTFLRYLEVWQALKDLEDILKNKSWQDPRYQIRETVT